MLHYGDLDESPQGEVPFELLSDKSKTPWKCRCPPPHTSRHATMTLCGRANSFIPKAVFLFLLVPVSDIKSVVTGKDCPHMKEKSALKQNKVGISGSSYINCSHVTRMWKTFQCIFFKSFFKTAFAFVLSLIPCLKTDH